MPTSGLFTLFTIVFGKMGRYCVLLRSHISPSIRQYSKKSSLNSLENWENLLSVFFWAPRPFIYSFSCKIMDLIQNYGLFPILITLQLLINRLFYKLGLKFVNQKHLFTGIGNFNLDQLLFGSPFGIIKHIIVFLVY